jgi:MFS family permease
MSFAVVIPAFLAMGFSLSFLGGVVGYQPFYSQFPQIDTATTAGAIKKHNALIQGVTVATLNLGAILGCFSVMYLGNKLGRRKTTFVGAVVTLVGTVLQCSAFSIAQLIVGRCTYDFVDRWNVRANDQWCLVQVSA